MRLNTKGWVTAMVTVSLVGSASAQPDQAQGQGEGQASERQGDVSTAELMLQEDVQLTPQQMLAKANEHIARVDQASRSIRQQLTLARQERDVVKTLCLNDKLNQINVALASANERHRALEALVTANDVDRAKHEFTIITVLRSRVETLVAEANQCIGEELGYVGESSVTVDIDPEIPDTDPAGFPGDPFTGGPTTVISQPPKPVSPG